MINKFLSLVQVAVLCTGITYGQAVCGTDDLYNKLKAANPQIAVNESLLEQEIQAAMKKIDFSKAAAKGTADDSTFYDVPIVVHVIHDYGTEYMTDDVIFNAFNNWQEAFLALNSDTADVITPFKPYIGNARIRLHLATKDPNGNPTKGITRRRSYLTTNAGDQAKLDYWPQNSYINIWLVAKFSTDHSGAAAYAYYPSSGAGIPYYDGVICLANYVDYDKTIPHELGHVLNLSHTWGSTNSAGVACGDDNVDDTPPTDGHSGGGCSPGNIFDVNCATGYIKNGIDYPDTANAQNIMDYTYCEKMFTKGQVLRMRAALTSSTAGRSTLYTIANINKTGAILPMQDLPPVADFSVEKGTLMSERAYFLCANSATNFSFRNRSWNDTITGVQWTFSNGAVNPTSTAMNTINNQFSQPGWVTIALTVTGNNSGNTTLTNANAVYVADNNAQQGQGYYQGFNNQGDIGNWPMFNYYNNTFQWQWNANAGYDGNGCIRYRSFDGRTSPENKSGTPDGDYDDIFTPAIDLTLFSGKTAYLNFYTAGSKKWGSPTDTMLIYASDDCGKSWDKISVLAGSALLNNASTSAEFVPTSAGQWKAQTVAIPSAYYTNKTFFRLRYMPAEQSNNLYLDRFGITEFTTEVSDVTKDEGAIKIFPNPAQGDCIVAFNSGIDAKASVHVRDITGRLIYSKMGVYAPNSLVQEKLARSVFPQSGFYIVTVTLANKTLTQKLVIE